jgi:hypothetical protein
MTTFTDTEAEQKLSAILDQADSDGEVRIRRANGKVFMIRPARSPLDVGFVDVQPPLSVDEIVQVVREGRERG